MLKTSRIVFGNNVQIMQYKNPTNPVYISYAWANETNPTLENDVDKLCALMEKNGIFYKRDKDGLCPYRWSIHRAEEEIGEGCAVIVVISEKYIKSLHCMHEWHLIKENGKIWERVFPVVLPGADLTNKAKYKEYYKFYNDRKKELVEQQCEGIIPMSHSELEAARYGYYISDLADMYQYLTDYNNAKYVIANNDYEALISQLAKHVAKQSHTSSPAVETKTEPKAETKADVNTKADAKLAVEVKVEPKNEATVDDNEVVYSVLTQAQTALLQKNLNATRKFFMEHPDGEFGGWITGSCIKSFLTDVTKDLKTDGIYNNETKNVVERLQRFLSADYLSIFKQLKFDGLFGPKTEAVYDEWAKKYEDKNADKKVLDK